MPAVPQTKATWTNGIDALDSTNLHAYLRDPLAFLMSKPVAELRSSVTQNIPTGAFTALTFDVEVVDTDPDGIGGHSTVANTSRYTARYAGWYQCGASITYGTNTTGRRGMRWAVNGTAVPASAVLLPPSGAATSAVAAPGQLIHLNEGDYLEAQAFQDSGVSLSTLSSSDNQSRMTVEWSRL